MLRLWTHVTVSPTVAARNALAAEAIGGHLRAAGLEQGDEFGDVGLLAEVESGEHFGDRSADRFRWCGKQHWWRRGCARVPGGGTVADEDDFGAVAGVAGAGHLLWEVGAWIVAAEEFGVGAIEHREAHRRVEPVVWFLSEFRVDRQSRSEHVPGRLADLDANGRGRATAVLG